MNQEAKVILKEMRLCPDCGNELRVNASMPHKLELPGWVDEYLFCDTCNEEWFGQLMKCSMISKPGDDAKQFTL